MIANVEIANFRCIRQARFDLDHVTWIAGPNGGGKTSIAAAIEYCLTGGNEWTDGRGAGLDTQVLHDQKKADVRLTLGETVLARAIPPPKGVKQVDASMEESLGVRRDLIRACLRTRHFFASSKAEQKDLLLAAFAGARDAQSVREALDAFTPEFPDLGEWLQKSGALTGTIDFEALHKTWYDERTGAKRDLRSLEERIKALDSEPEPAPNTGQSDSLRADLQDLDRRIGEARGRSLAGRQVYTVKLRERNAAVSQRASARAASELAGQHVTNAMQMVTGLQNRIKERHGEQPQSLDLKVLRAEQDALVGEMTAANATEVCPKGKCAKTMVRDIANRLQRNGDAILLAEAEAKHHDACERVREAEANLQSIVVPDLPEEPADDAACGEKVIRPLEAERQRVDAALRAAEGKANLRVRWESIQRELAGLREKLTEQRDYVLRLEAVVSALGPHGIGAAMVEKDLARLEERTRSLAEDFFEMGFRLDRNPWGAWAHVGTVEHWIPVEQLSWSERARISACFQVALAEQCGFGLVLLDETGGDPTVRGQIAEMLLDVDVQSVVFSTAQETDASGLLVRPDAPDIIGMRTYWVDGGAVVDLTPAVRV